MTVLGKCHEDINACDPALKNVIDMQHLSVISSVQMDISSMQMEKKKKTTTTKKQNNNAICTEHCELRTKNGPSKNHVKV